MRCTLATLTALSLLFAFAASAQPGEDKEARAVVAKGIAALGGAANLAKHKATTWTETGTYYGTGQALPYTGKYAMQWPDQFRMEIKDVFTIVLNGEQGWIKSPQGTMEMNKEQLGAQVQSNRAGWIGSLAPLGDTAFALKLLGDAKVGDKPVRVVEVSRKDYPTVKLYFDKADGLRLKSEYRTKSPELNFQEVTMEMYYYDYRDVDGAKVPYKINLKRDGKDFVEAEMMEVRAVGKLDAKVFAKPAD